MAAEFLSDLQSALQANPSASKVELYNSIQNKALLDELTFGEAEYIDRQLFHFKTPNTHWTKSFGLPEENQVVDGDDSWLAKDVGVFTFKLISIPDSDSD